MNDHTAVLYRDGRGWTVECTCTNPDGNGEGAKQWHADTQDEAMDLFLDHKDEETT